MRIFAAIKTCFAKYVSVQGTASRGEFWFWILFASILLCITLIIDGALLGPWIGGFTGQEVMAFDQDAGKWLSLVTLIALVSPTVTVAIRRLHDSGFSGWWLLIGATLVGIVPLLFLFLKRGKKTENRFRPEA